MNGDAGHIYANARGSNHCNASLRNALICTGSSLLLLPDKLGLQMILGGNEGYGPLGASYLGVVGIARLFCCDIAGALGLACADGVDFSKQLSHLICCCHPHPLICFLVHPGDPCYPQWGHYCYIVHAEWGED